MILFNLAIYTSLAGNPYVQGNWKGRLISNYLDAYNKNGLPVSLYLMDDKADGNLVGEMTIRYRYQEDVYSAKYKVSGKIDYSSYKFNLTQTEIIFGDVLPKGLQWCAGKSDNLGIYRSSNIKRFYIDGIFGKIIQKWSICRYR